MNNSTEDQHDMNAKRFSKFLRLNAGDAITQEQIRSFDYHESLLLKKAASLSEDISLLEGLLKENGIEIPERVGS